MTDAIVNKGDERAAPRRYPSTALPWLAMREWRQETATQQLQENTKTRKHYVPHILLLGGHAARRCQCRLAGHGVVEGSGSESGRSRPSWRWRWSCRCRCRCEERACQLGDGRRWSHRERNQSPHGSRVSKIVNQQIYVLPLSHSRTAVL